MFDLLLLPLLLMTMMMMLSVLLQTVTLMLMQEIVELFPPYLHKDVLKEEEGEEI